MPKIKKISYFFKFALISSVLGFITAGFPVILGVLVI